MALGQTARFERFAATMLYYIAAGKHIDTNRTDRFEAQVEEVFKNPFEERKPMTAAEIVAHIYRELTEE